MAKITLRDKLALIYTSAGSQRSVAAFVGISHQKVGRILAQSYVPNSRTLKDPGLNAAIDAAFSIHKQVTREQARIHKLPYSDTTPVFYKRMPFKDGTPGDRVAALHTHHLSNEQRNRWIEAMHASNRFAALSVQSIVNLVVYNKRADDRVKRRDSRMREDRQSIQRKISESVIQGPMFTKYTPMDRAFPIDIIIDDVNEKLETRHDPCIGDPGTALATAMLLQVDSRHGKDAQFRGAHPRPAKRRKAKKRAQGNQPRGNAGKARLQTPLRAPRKKAAR